VYEKLYTGGYGGLAGKNAYKFGAYVKLHLALTAVVATVLLSVAVGVQAAKPLVVASINPVALLAEELGGDDIDVLTLVPPLGSHHDYPLKPSDHKRLQSADLVLWVGPSLESFLEKPLASLSPQRVMRLSAVAELHWPEVAGHSDYAESDPHFWLDISNVVVAAKAIRDRLIQLDPTKKSQIEARYQQMAARLQKMDAANQLAFASLSSKPFLVYHDGLAHWAAHYHLAGYGFITLTPEQKPGAKHLLDLRKRYANSGGCVFLEPNTDPQATKTLAQELGMKLGILDIMGVNGVSRIDELLAALGVAFERCLKQP